MLPLVGKTVSRCSNPLEHRAIKQLDRAEDPRAIAVVDPSY